MFSPIFLVCYLPLQPGLLWWCEFLHTGCFFQCYFFFPLFPFLLSFIFCFRLAANSMQTGCSHCFPSRAGVVKLLCVYRLPPLLKVQGGGWDLAENGQVSFFLPFFPLWCGLIYSVTTFSHLAFIIFISSPVLLSSVLFLPFPPCLSSSAHSSTHVPPAFLCSQN